MSQRILMIEDDLCLATMVSRYLLQNGSKMQRSENAHDGLMQLRIAAATAPFSMVLLDLMLPDVDGLEVCRRLCAEPPTVDVTPVMMLTGKGAPMDRVTGLELGTDDYLGKPFAPRELLARVRAVLRRPLPVASEALTKGTFRAMRFGRLELDPDACALRIDRRPRNVTAYQFDPLVALAKRAGQCCRVNSCSTRPLANRRMCSIAQSMSASGACVQ